MQKLIYEQMTMFDADSQYGRTCQEHSPQTPEMTSELSWKNFAVSKTEMLQYLDLSTRKETNKSGTNTDASLEPDFLWLGERSMHSIGELHKGERELPYWLTSMETLPENCCYVTIFNPTEEPTVLQESHLSWVLEENVDEKYLLSAKACQGILNRASKRGKELPKILKEALESVVEMENSKTTH